MGDLFTHPLDLAIVIVNYNTCALLRDCLESVYASQGSLRLDVCVVDNASPDMSVGMVRTVFPQAHLIASGRNAGYPQANNQGLRYFGFQDESSTETSGRDGKPAALRPALESRHRVATAGALRDGGVPGRQARTPALPAPSSFAWMVPSTGLAGVRFPRPRPHSGTCSSSTSCFLAAGGSAATT